MLFESENFEKDLDHFKEQFEAMDKEIESVEKSIRDFCSTVKSPTSEYYKSATKTIALNQEIMLDHFKNTEDYLKQVKQNYDR